ncbi:MAG: hypothetical protein B6242_01095 [Anaerolineaceae bacterium 4572_78]|nr:MAG: hypothetical protein B6242_01095 [Anaerolineaceae bacterium 4572_78]
MSMLRELKHLILKGVSVAINDIIKLASYVPPVVAQTIYHNQGLPQRYNLTRYQAVILFADVSGFTPLAEKLSRKGPEGAEELTRVLNLYFSRMIELTEKEGGQVVKFGGDAMIVVFPSTDDKLGYTVSQAEQTAQAMQAVMRAEYRHVETIIGSIELDMTVSIGAGEIIAMNIGGTFEQGEFVSWDYVITGDPLRQISEAEAIAEKGDVVLSPEAKDLLRPDRFSKTCQVSHTDWHTLSEIQQEAVIEALQAYVPDTITHRIEADQAEWLAELRRLTVVFIKAMTGIDYKKENILDQLQVLFTTTETIIHKYDGRIVRVSVDDKGTMILALFGAPPFSHENDPERCVRFALDLQKNIKQHGITVAIGMTTGQLFTGPVGGETRREYTVMGDKANMAARLMGVAAKAYLKDPTDVPIRCDEDTYKSAKNRIRFKTLPPVKVKGKTHPVPLYFPIGKIAFQSLAIISTETKFVGREQELSKIKSILDNIASGTSNLAPGASNLSLTVKAKFDTPNVHSHVLFIEGEAGIGKSRFVAEIHRLAQELNIRVLMGAGLSIEQNTPYRVWRDIFFRFFNIEQLEGKNQSERHAYIENRIHDLNPSLIQRSPLLNDILNVGLPENELTQSLDPKLRRESLTSLLIDLLRAELQNTPLIITIEDAHWLDPSSWELALEVARSLEDYPVLLLVPLRPLQGEEMRLEYVALTSLPNTKVMTLDIFSDAEIIDLIKYRLDVSEFPEEVTTLIKERSQGNPFFAEELIHTLRDENVISIQSVNGHNRCLLSGSLEQLTLPDNIQGVVMARIDRLPPETYLTVRVASVIGRTFAFNTLNAIYPKSVSYRRLRTYLDSLVYLDLTPYESPESMISDDMLNMQYIFKHIITQEVAYSTLLYSQRRQFHTVVAQWYENTYNQTEESLAPYYSLLVHHYYHAENREQERNYCTLAGKQAAAQFANEMAVDYLNRALGLLDIEQDLANIKTIFSTMQNKSLEEELFDLISTREIVYNRMGKRDLQLPDLEALLMIAKAWDDKEEQAKVYNRQSAYYEQVGRYNKAISVTNTALDIARQVKNRSIEGKSLSRLSVIVQRQSRYEEGITYGKQALTIFESTSEKQSKAYILTVLGNIHFELGENQIAQDYYRQDFTIRQAIGDLFGEGMVLFNSSNPLCTQGYAYDAHQYRKRALDIFRKIGFRQGIAYASGGLGQVYQNIGNYLLAKKQLSQAISIFHTINNSFAKAIGLHNIGLVCHALGEYENAQNYCEQAINIQQDIGDKRGKGFSLTYLGLPLESLGKWGSAHEANSILAGRAWH